METTEKKEDNRAVKIFIVEPEADTFAETLGIPEERIDRIGREVHALYILENDVCSCMEKISWMFTDHHEVAFALYVLGKRHNATAGIQLMGGSFSDLPEELKEIIKKIVKRKED